MIMASSSNHTIPCIDLTGDDDSSSNFIPEIIDLTDDDNQYFTSSIPAVDLTTDNNQFLNYRIPNIDLTDDDVLDITHQTQRVGSTYNNTLISNPTIQNFNPERNDDQEINLNTKPIDLTYDDVPDINPDIPVIDLTSDNNQFLNDGIQDIEMANDDVWDVTHELKNFDLSESKQQNIKDRTPRNDFTNKNNPVFNRIFPISDLTNDKDNNADLIRNDDIIFRNPVDDVEMIDLSHNDSPSVIENIHRIPAEPLSYNTTEDNSFKFNETSSTNEKYFRSFSKMQKIHRRKEILESLSIKNNIDGKIEIDYLKNHKLKNNFEDNIETERVSTGHSLENKSRKKYWFPEKSEKIFQNDTSDFLKPAHFPIPLRHSFGRSISNTSQNIPIECVEVSEDQPSTLTVSTIIRRKKSKSAPDISKRIPTKSKSLSASEENGFSFQTFTDFFRKFWIILLLSFAGLYYWIL